MDFGGGGRRREMDKRVGEGEGRGGKGGRGGGQGIWGGGRRVRRRERVKQMRGNV